MANPTLSEQIEEAKSATQEAKEHLLKVFSFVPDDKLNWTPGEPARTALWMVAHCGASNGAFATILSGKELSFSGTPEEISEQIRNGGRDAKIREEVVKAVEDSTAAVLAALDTVTEERLASSPPTPAGTFPFAIWMSIPADHMKTHAAQLDYLQTCWGDLKNH